MRAPVDGTVSKATSYEFYDRYTDERVEIRPDADPYTTVVMLHVEGLRVEVGDRVEAGETRVADGASRLPFESQIDRFTEQVWPHVHVEVRTTP